ncbi:hypothetical protein [Streptomyces flaveolus]|uniref:hypothetical protein n=1 Tax=Streptomyces flaveolus TaxID=67297 RepID=UPI00340AC282
MALRVCLVSMPWQSLVRPDRESRRLVIEDGADHFLALAEAEQTSDLPAATLDALQDAVDAELALVAGHRLLVLPYRMRHWPVPYLAV